VINPQGVTLAMDFTSKNLTIPRGKVFFGPFLAGTYNPGAFIDLGNVPSLTFQGDIQKLPHYSSMAGMREKDRDIVVGRDLTATLVTDDMGLTNRRLWLTGSVATVTTAALTDQEDVFEDAGPGDIFQLGRTDANPTGHRGVTVTAVVNGATTYDVTDDYLVHSDIGMIEIVEGGAIAAGTDLTVTYDVAAASRQRVASGDVEIEGELKIVAFNAVGDQIDYTFPRVQISGSGGLDLMQDPESPAFQQMTLDVSLLKKGTLALAYADGRAVVA
jgi:hypothetical protein